MAAAASTNDGTAGDAGGAVLGDLSTPHPAHTHVAVTDDAAAGAVPLLVRVLAGNPLTGAAVLACLNTVDARHARRLHPAVAGTVAGVPWCDLDTPVVDVVQWRAGLPGAVGARLTGPAVESLLASKPAVAALGGITHLDLGGCVGVTDHLLLRLPLSLHVLNVRDCKELTARASFVHLTALASLDCGRTKAVSERTDGLPPSLTELDISWTRDMLDSVSLAHLRQLRVLRAKSSELRTSTLASLPRSLEELYASCCSKLTPEVSFAHLTALRSLDVARCNINDASLASMPPSLLSLNARGCSELTCAAVLPHLPALRLLEVSDTAIGDALVASLPASLIELRLAGCRGVTAGAILDHLHALRCIGTEFAPAALAACRARGCVVPAASELRGHADCVVALVFLGNGRLASSDINGEIRLWDVAAGGEATAVLEAGNGVYALAALQDGRRLAVGTALWRGNEAGIEVWDVASLPPVHHATMKYPTVWSLAALADGRLAAGYDDGAVRIVDVDAGVVVTTLDGHTGEVAALTVLPDGRLASGSTDKTVRVWDVGVGACVATLTGHTEAVNVGSLVVLSDGRLASGSEDRTVRLWAVDARTCVGVLGGLSEVRALAALRDGRLATGSNDGTVQLWDTRPAAAAGASRVAGAVPVEVVGVLGSWITALLALPDGRLACSDNGIMCLLEPPVTYEYR